MATSLILSFHLRVTELIRVLQQRFGEIPAFLEVRLESESVEQLESLMDVAIAVTSLEEFITNLPA